MDNEASTSRSNSIVIQPDDAGISVAQAIYHHVTGKTERIFEAFSGVFKVELCHISQLHHKIAQTAQRHHQDEKNCSVDVALHKKERVRSSSYERFSQMDWAVADPVSEIVYTYNFLSHNNVAPAGTELKPENYKIVVTINQDTRFDSEDDDEEMPYYLRSLFTGRSIRVSINYVDYTIARAILAAVREWVDALPKGQKGRLATTIIKSGDSIKTVVPYLLVAISVLALGYFSLMPAIENNSTELVQKLIPAIAGTITLFGFSLLAIEGIVKSAHYMSRSTYILLTSGDKAREAAKEKKIATMRWHLGFWSLSIVLSLSLNILGSYLFENYIR
jgi:hypothetical protein